MELPSAVQISGAPHGFCQFPRVKPCQSRLKRPRGWLKLIRQALGRTERQQAQRLGIRDARIELSARQGVWTLTQRFNGRVLGDVQARQQLTARPAHRLPDVHSPLSGELAFNAPSLRPWGNWLPAGWRLGGKLQAWAALSGSLAEPRLTGGVRGEELSASQLLKVVPNSLVEALAHGGGGSSRRAGEPDRWIGLPTSGMPPSS